MSSDATAPTTRFLPRPEGRLAYDVQGDGPLVVCTPGLGDLRREFRALVPQLLAAGYRVATVDLRGHGESDATFTDHERPTVGDDLVALIRELGGPAHLVGVSFSAAAAVHAAAVAPGLVSSLTLIGPFVRQPQTVTLGARLQRAALGALLHRPWGPRAWAAYVPKLYPGRRPADLDAHLRDLVANLREPGRIEAVRAMAISDCRAIDPLLDGLTRPVTVVMGSADPDFPDPAAEADAIAARTAGRVVMVEGAGHYPHVEDPETTGPAILAALAAATPTR